MATSPQRAYRAACPNCGAPVEFASAASASAVCSFCRSTLVRDGEALKRIGTSAELFDDHSPLQLGVQGQRAGVGFTLVGRLQYGYEGGTWNEWHALFDNGKSGWLSEDNGAYVFSFDGPLPADAPALAALRAGTRALANGRAWDVASVTQARLIAAQGELPTPPRLPARVHWSVGASVALSELALSGLKDISEKTLGSRSLECPSCGTALEVKLATTQSIACHQCSAVVDISAGLGGELKHYTQSNAGTDGAEPLIPLGRTGTLALGGQGAQWQVVGYQERCDLPEDSEDDTSFWREYLLYNRTEGFAFLVDTDDGWSWVKPITGVPTVRGDSATWQGATYRRKWSYAAKVTWVQGEFYWRVQRNERAQVQDWEGTGADSARRLSREQAGNEVTWSAGRTIAAAEIAAAFKIDPARRGALDRDVKPLASFSGSSMGFSKLVLIFVAFIVVAILMAQCSDDGCDDIKRSFGAASNEYQQCARSAGSGSRSGSGGSFGGWSSGGGGHK